MSQPTLATTQTSNGAHRFAVTGRDFGQQIIQTENGQYEVEILGVDIFDPTSGEVTPSDADDIACWFIDTDYTDEAFFVRLAPLEGGWGSKAA